MTTVIASSPLPALDSPRIEELRLSERPHLCSAYDLILRAERHAVQRQANEDTICARVAGYLLLEFHAQSDFFGDSACASIVTWVTSLPQDPSGDEHSVIFEAGRLLRDKFIRLFRTSTISYPPPSSRTSRPPFETLEDMTKDSMEATGNDYRSSGRKALARDGFRCIITSMINYMSFKRSAALRDIAERDQASTAIINACHILNSSTMQGTYPAGISEDSAVTHYAAGAMALLEHLGFSRFTEAFKRSGGVHEVWNLLSLEPNLHLKFGQLDLWFERTSQPNRYKVCVFHESDERYIRRNFVGPKDHVDGAPMVVELASSYQEAPPPDPQLLALHATCARVAHMSGAAKFFNQMQWDAEETDVLAFDGSSAGLLSSLISPFSVIHGIGL